MAHCDIHRTTIILQIEAPGPEWLPKAPFTRYNLLSNGCTTQFDNTNRIDNRLYRVYTFNRLSHSLSNPFDNRLNEQWLFVQYGCQTALTTGLTTGCTTGLTTGCIV